MRHVGERKYYSWRREAVPANLDVNGIKKDLFVQFVGYGCPVDKARDRPGLVFSTLHNSIIRLFLN